MEVLPGDTYRVAEVASDGREVYATTTHTTQLKSWKIMQHADSEDEVEGEDQDGDVRHEVERQDRDGDVRHEVEGEDRDGDVRREVEGEDRGAEGNPTNTRSSRIRRPPAYLSDFKLN